MANQYDTNLKLQAIADAIGDSQSSGLISALEDIADAVAGGGGGGSAAAGLVSDNFSDTRTYSVGDYCIHNNTLYKCIRDISTAGPWDLSDWVSTNTGVELSSLNSALVKIKESGTLSFSGTNHTGSADLATAVNVDKSRIIGIMPIQPVTGLAAYMPAFIYDRSTGNLTCYCTTASFSLSATFLVQYI